MIVALLLASALAFPPQAGKGNDSLRAFTEPEDSAALVAAVNRRPDDARDALGQLLSLTTTARSDSASAARLTAAMRLAHAYAQVWRDSFPLRLVTAFASWGPDHRAAKVAIDSLRREGVQTSRRVGVAAAMRLWRRSLHLAIALADSAGQAMALGNIGAGFYLQGEADSASAYLARSRDGALAIGDLRTAANAIGTLAAVARDRGDLTRARELYSTALPLRERIGDVGGQAADRNNLGLLAQSLGDMAEARRAFEAALVLNRRYGRALNVATNVTNLANLAAIAGDYRRAGALYDDALQVYRESGDVVDEAFVLRNAGQLEVRRGDYRRACSKLRQALSIYEFTGPTVDAIDTRRDLALALTAMGDLQGALSELRRAEARAQRAHAPPALLATLAMTGGDLAIQFNNLAEADRDYARADRLSRAADDETGELAARQARGLLLLLRQDYDGALGLLQSAARAQSAAGDRRAEASTELLVGYAQQQRGDMAAARRTLARALANFHVTADAVGEAQALASIADAQADDGQPVAAESSYRAGLALLKDRVAPSVAWRLHAGLGEVLQSRGALGDAIHELQRAAAEADRTASGLRLEERRSAFLEDKWSVYTALAFAERARGDDSAAFAASERMRARELLDLVARGMIAPALIPDSTRQREQDLRRQIGELTRLVLGDVPRGTLRGVNIPAAPLDAVRDALDSAQRAYGALLLDAREASPEYVRLVTGESVGWREIGSRLTPDEAMIEYVVADSTSLAFVVTSSGIASVDLHVTRHTLATLVEFARANLARPDDAAARALWRAPLRRLYQQLVEPLDVAGYLAGKHTLIIVPHRELHYLPFAALLAPAASGQRERFLIERYALSYTPSASLWLRLQERPTSAVSDRVLVLAPRPDALPGSRNEAAAIQRTYGSDATVLTGGAATARAFRAAAPGAAIVHLATFGVLNKRNPLFSFVELAPADSNDGRLEVQDVFGLSLNARLVVLSACQTAVGSGALGDVPEGDDWVGLVQAFFFAGASNVLGTLWPVEDRATARLMESFYQAMSTGHSEAEALALAQRAALRGSATAHPFFWAGFAMFGRRDACSAKACTQQWKAMRDASQGKK